MDLLQRLETENRGILRGLERLDDRVARPDERREETGARRLARELQDLLRRHDALEKKLLFPRLRRWAPEGEPTLREMERAHAGIDALLDELVAALPAGDERA